MRIRIGSWLRSSPGTLRGVDVLWGLLIVVVSPLASVTSQMPAEVRAAGSNVPFVALGSVLFVILVGSLVLWAARRATRDD